MLLGYTFGSYIFLERERESMRYCMGDATWWWWNSKIQTHINKNNNSGCALSLIRDLISCSPNQKSQTTSKWCLWCDVMNRIFRVHLFAFYFFNAVVKNNGQNSSSNVNSGSCGFSLDWCNVTRDRDIDKWVIESALLKLENETKMSANFKFSTGHNEFIG